jgi:ATP-dependent helicase/nuclease subunit A
VLVLGETFPTAPQEISRADPVPPLPDFSGLATPPVPNPAQSPEQQRGEWIHAALQGLTVAAPLAAQAEAAAVAARVRATLPWLFGPGSLAEVAVVLPGGGVGRIDRLVPHDGALWIIDFKTGVPQASVPPAYVAQLQGYAAALAADQAGEQTLRLGLVWVDAMPNPTLAEVAVSG